MNIIYTVTVAMAQRVSFMGGKLMHAHVTGEKTCNFATPEEADKFVELMKAKGYSVETGVVRASAEEAARQVAEYHSKLGSSFGRPVLSKVS